MPAIILSRISAAAVIGALAWAMGWCASAQSIDAKLSGLVTDPAAAAVSGATVRARHETRNTVVTVTSNSLGLYTLPDLVPGPYTIEVEKNGFGTLRRPGVVLSVGASVAIHFRLELAPIATSVTIEGGAPLVETTHGQLSDLVGQNRILALPINTRSAARNVYDLILSGAGAAPAAVFKEDEYGPHIHGARTASGNYQLDGAENNYRQAAAADLFSVPVPVEAVAEFRVLTNTFAAEYGRNGGFVANAVTRSGTNEVHGTLWEFLRNNLLDARDASTRRTGVRREGQRQNNYGAAAGGPLRRDRAFFFAAYEGFRKGADSGASAVVPTPAFMDGMPAGFAKDLLRKTYGSLAPVQDFVDFYGSYAVDPVKKTGYAKTVRNDPGFPHPQFGTAFYRNDLKTDSENALARVDSVSHDGRDRLSARYAGYRRSTETAFLNGIPGNQPDPSIGGHNMVVTHVRTLSAGALNEARAAFNRYTNRVRWRYGEDGLPVMSCSVQVYGQQGPCFGLPGIGLDPSVSRNYRENSLVLLDNLSLLSGRHHWKLGGEYRRNFDRTVGGGGSVLFGQLLFADAISFANNIPLQVTVQVDPAAAGKGQIVAAIPERRWRQHEIYWFAQDEFRATRRLSLTWGVRYEFYSVPHNLQQELDSNFYFDGANVGEGAFRRTLDNPGDLNGRFWRADRNNFAPRFGLAFDPFGDGRTSLRAGFGLGYDRMINNQYEAIKNNLPSVALVTLRNDFAAGVVPVPSLTFPLVASIRGGTPLAALPGAARAVDPNLRTSYYLQSSLGVQRQLGHDLALEVNTIWNAGRKLGLLDYFNRRPGGLGKTLNAVLGSDVFASNYRSNSVGSNYNALEAKLRRRFSRGFYFETNYTWAHSLDAASGLYNGSQAQRGLVDFGNWRLSYGNSDFDVRHRWSSTFQFDLPALAGVPRLLSSAVNGWTIAGIVTAATGTPFSIIEQVDDPNRDGWGFDYMTFSGTGNQSSAILSRPAPVKGGVQYLDPALFTFTGDYSLPGHAGQRRAYGNTGRNQIYGPGRWDCDLGLHKSFRLPLSDRAALQVRAELFNALNHPNLDRPQGTSISGAGLLSGVFGQAYYAGGRQAQLALRFSF